MATNAPRDDNHIPTMLGVSKVDLKTPVPIAVNPVNNALLVEVG